MAADDDLVAAHVRNFIETGVRVTADELQHGERKSHTGARLGAAAGGLIGSRFGPVGAVVGSAVGEAAGGAFLDEDD